MPRQRPSLLLLLFEGHAELLDRWQPICNILVLQSRLCAVELLDCIWQYASLARLITNRRATCGQAEHLKVWCSNPGIVGMSARTTSLNCISAPQAKHCIAHPPASPRRSCCPRMVKVFKPVGNRCSRRGAMWCGKAVGHARHGVQQEFRNKADGAPDRLRPNHSLVPRCPS